MKLGRKMKQEKTLKRKQSETVVYEGDKALEFGRQLMMDATHTTTIEDANRVLIGKPYPYASPYAPEEAAGGSKRKSSKSSKQRNRSILVAS
jgi:hypothetical protein